MSSVASSYLNQMCMCFIFVVMNEQIFKILCFGVYLASQSISQLFVGRIHFYNFILSDQKKIQSFQFIKNFPTFGSLIKLNGSSVIRTIATFLLSMTSSDQDKIQSCDYRSTTPGIIRNYFIHRFFFPLKSITEFQTSKIVLPFSEIHDSQIIRGNNWIFVTFFQTMRSFLFKYLPSVSAIFYTWVFTHYSCLRRSLSL